MNRVLTGDMIRQRRLSFKKRREILDEAARSPDRSVRTSNQIDPATIDTRLYGHHRSAAPELGVRVWVFESELKASRFRTAHARFLL